MKAFACLLATAAVMQAAERPTLRNPVNRSADPWPGHAEARQPLSTTLSRRVQLRSSNPIDELKKADEDKERSPVHPDEIRKCMAPGYR